MRYPSADQWAVLGPMILCGAIGVVTSGRPAAADVLDRAREACAREAREAGFRVDDVRDADRTGNQRVRLDLRLERRGDSYRARCDYDDDDRRARLDVADADRGDRDRDSGRIAQRAREACRDEARDKGFDVRDIGDADVNDERARLRLRLERHDRRYDATCRYDDQDRRARLDVEDRGDNDDRRGNAFFGGRDNDGGGSAGNARDRCVERATNQGSLQLAYTGRVREERNDLWRVPVSVYAEGNQRWFECWYDARSRSVELRPSGPFQR